MHGVSAEEIAHILGHSSVVVAKHYILATPALALIRAKALGSNPVWQNMVAMMLTGKLVPSKEWDSHARRIARAVDIIRAKYEQPLRIKTLADAAGMSISVFHKHFRNVTTLTPLQFQKQLRLVEARKLMLVQGAAISTAAHRVGYESVTQFTREYSRMFGQPPARSIRDARESE